MDGFGVAHGDLESHANYLDGVSAAAEGQFAGTGVDLGAETFGVIGAFFAQGAREEETKVSQAGTDTARSFQDLGAGVRAVAADYRDIDQHHAEMLSGLDEV
jgi:hypothetical protein